MFGAFIAFARIIEKIDAPPSFILLTVDVVDQSRVWGKIRSTRLFGCALPSTQLRNPTNDAVNLLSQLSGFGKTLKFSTILCYEGDYFKISLGVRMRRLLANSCFAVLGMLALSACSSVAIDPDTGMQFRAADVPENRLVTEVSVARTDSNEKDLIEKEMKEVRDLTSDQFNEVLSELPRPPCEPGIPPELCSRDIQASTIRSLFGSVSGITTWEFYRTAFSRGNIFGKRNTKVRGKILRECLHDKNLAGYEYDDIKRTLRLCVVMITNIPRPKDGARVRFQYFHVEAVKVGVDEKRTSDGGPYPGGYDAGNVFHDAFEKTGLRVSAAVAEDFKYKLFAHGTNIKVVRYWEANTTSLFGKATFKKYRPGDDDIVDNRISWYFDESDRACVDMMFPVYPPPKLPNDAEAGRDYCLGRCDNPPIVNTK